MDIENELAKNSREVDRLIEDFFSKKVSKEWLAKAFGRHNFDAEAVNSALAWPVWYILKKGGKRIRPFILLRSCEAAGGSKKTAAEFMPVPELIHNGTLIADDIEDNSEQRRGAPSVHVQFGIDIATNASGFMYYLPALIIKKSGLSSSKKLMLYEIINTELAKLHIGQATDIFWHNRFRKISEDKYFSMCALKTGTLMRLSAKMGAVIAGASEKQVYALGNFAQSLGVAFQIQDDILNLKGTVGKDFGEDITEGKLSLPAIRAINNAGQKEKERLVEILSRHTKSRKLIDEAIGIIRNSGSIEYSAKTAERIVKEAWDRLSPLLPESDAKNSLKELSVFAVSRKI